MDMRSEYMIEMQDQNNAPILAHYFMAASDEAALYIFRQFVESDLGKYLASAPGADRWDMYLIPEGLHPIRALILGSVRL